MPNIREKTSMRRNRDGKPTYVWLLWDPMPDTTTSGYFQSAFQNLDLSQVSVIYDYMKTSGNVNIVARVRGEGWAINSGDIPDSTWPAYNVLPTSGAGSNPLYFYSETNAIAVGKRMADWFEYQSLDSRVAHEYINGKPYAGGIFPHEWARPQWGKTIYYEPEDAVVDVVTGEELARFTNKEQILSNRRSLRHNVGFLRNALAKSRTNQTIRDSAGNQILILGLTNWIIKVGQTLKEEIDRRSVGRTYPFCYPAYLSLDLEDFGPRLFGYVGSDTPDSGLPDDALPERIDPLYHSSVFRSLQADPRYATEIVWEEWTGTQWVGRTWQDTYNMMGSPAHTYDYMTGSAQNQTFVRKLQPYIMKMMDYALWKFIYEPLKSIFPGIKCGNYGIYVGTSLAYWDIPSKNNSWLRTPVDGDLPTNRMKLRADYGAPYLYTPNVKNPVNSPGPGSRSALVPYYSMGIHWHNPEFASLRGTLTTTGLNRIRQLNQGKDIREGHGFGTTNSLVYRNCLKSIIQAANPRKDPNIKTHPYFETPEIPQWNRDAAAVVPHIASLEDIFDVMRYSHSWGNTVFHIFNSFNHIPPDHPNASLRANAWNTSQTVKFLELFSAFDSYIYAQNPKPPTSLPGGSGLVGATAG